MFSGHNVAFFLNAAPIDSHWLTQPGIAFWVVTRWWRMVDQSRTTAARDDSVSELRSPCQGSPFRLKLPSQYWAIKAPRPLGKPHLGPVFWPFASVVLHPLLPWLSLLQKNVCSASEGHYVQYIFSRDFYNFCFLTISFYILLSSLMWEPQRSRTRNCRFAG